MDEPTLSKQLITEIPVDDDELETIVSTDRTSIKEIRVPEEHLGVEEDFLEDYDTSQKTAAIPGMTETVDTDGDVEEEDDQEERIKRVSIASRRLSNMARSYSVDSAKSDDSVSDRRPSRKASRRKQGTNLQTEDQEGPKEGERKVSTEPGAVQKKAIPKTHSHKSEVQSIESSGPVSDPNKTQDNFITPSNDSNGDDFDEFFDFGHQPDYVLKHEFAEIAEEESLPSIVEEEEELLDRTPYYENYDTIMEELVLNRLRNNLLQKLLIKFFRRRKMSNYLKDVEPPLEEVLKYRQKLDTYKQFMEINEFERNIVGAEVNSLRAHRNKKNLELTNLFKSMQSKEQNVGSGLIYSKTGNQIPDKLVERFIKRQATQVNQVATMRLKYIKLKGMVQEKQNAIEKLDTIEGNLHLTDYEQLKNENRTFLDKLEERDVELTRLRIKCQHTIQILAHMREKTAALDIDVYELRDEYQFLEGQTVDFREQLANLKHSRDRYRQMSNKIQDESGLLTKPHLLLDMEYSQDQLGNLEKELNKCKKDVAIKKAVVKRLREKIEELTEEVNRKKAARTKSRLSTRSYSSKSKTVNHESKNIYPRRPTLYRPVIKQEMFADLVKIKPGVMVFDKRRRSFI